MENRRIISVSSGKKVISCGIALFHINKEKVLLVQRRHSAALLQLLKTIRYSDMVNLLKEMTQEEISQFVSHWKEGTLLKYRKEILNSDNHDNNMFTEEKYSKIFTTALKEKWGKEENEWSFPKGKIEFKENKLTCALRELKEETGIKACDIWTCNKGVVFTNKCRNYDYELNIFPALTFNDFSFSYENNIEVGNIAWFDLAGITKKVFIKASELQELLKLFPWKKNDSLEDKKI